jgi:hypothetical protein
MKTTNFENSKKLAEIGFKVESETRKHDPKNFVMGQKYWSYDLETILQTLPKTLVLDDGLPTIYQGKLKIFFDIENKNYIGY